MGPTAEGAPGGVGWGAGRTGPSPALAPYGRSWEVTSRPETSRRLWDPQEGEEKGRPARARDLPVRLAQKDELEARGARGVKSGVPGVRTPTVLETALPRARQAPPVNIGERPLSSQQERGQGRTVKRPGELCSRRPDSREASRN